MEEDYQRALQMSFSYGYGCYAFKHDIFGDQPEVPDCTPNSPKFLSLECFTSIRCPLVSAFSEVEVTVVEVQVQIQALFLAPSERWWRSRREVPLSRI